ncbi:hypothetical protein CH304_20120 [Rhodococcus sp. 15-649-1-2]|nr:hypothetical protein [Rhodococcus sp. 15-649-1-2]OZE79280.1 hypothetical protein CH304_20120 [Rhodococcus sp. 15-649-1-2]
MTDPNETISSLPAWAQKIITDLRSEAAGYRQQATDLKAERDTLRTQANERATAEALAGLSKVLTDPEDLTRFVDTDTLLGDDGRPDPAKYLDAATTLAAERPHLAPRVGTGAAPIGGRATAPESGATTDTEQSIQSGRSAFADAFRNAGASE